MFRADADALIAAKDREIAALRNEIAQQREYWTDQYCRWRKERAALSASRAPDPAEAMRAKCEAIALDRTKTEADYDDEGWHRGYCSAAMGIAREIAALKGNGEGKS